MFELKEHLLGTPESKSVTYLSPTSQKEIEKSGFHSASGDKVTSSNDEILSLPFATFMKI